MTAIAAEDEGGKDPRALCVAVLLGAGLTPEM